MDVIGLKKLQVGKQVSFDTAVAPTVQLSGIESFSLPPSLKTQHIRTANGMMGPGNRVIADYHEASGSINLGVVYYEQLPFYLQMLDEATVTGVGPYDYAISGPSTSLASPLYQTITAGATHLVSGLAGACIKSITFTWNKEQPVTASMELMGYAMTDDAFAALSETASASLTPMLGSHFNFYLDTWGGTAGTTELEQIQSGSITIDTQAKYQRRAGTQYPTGVYSDIGWAATGNFVLESDATTAGYVDSIMSGVFRKLLRFEATNGEASTDERTQVFDFVAEVTTSNPHGEDDGQIVHDFQFTSTQEDDGTYIDLVTTINDDDVYA